jgi:hypothetical protein
METGNRFYSEIRNRHQAFPKIPPALPFSKGGELLEKRDEGGFYGFSKN